MVDFATAIATATNAYNALKELRAAEKAYDEATYKLKISELVTTISELRETLAQARDEARDREQAIAALERSFERKSDLVEFRGYKYEKRPDDGKPAGHPYCPVCEQKGLLFLMHTAYKTGRPEQCPSCKTEITGANVFYPADHPKPQT
jgi:tetratricopeptide (TPR) repeat protein